MTFTKWLYYYKNFNSKTHFNRYIKSLNLAKEVEVEVIEYFKEQYNDYLIQNNLKA